MEYVVSATTALVVVLVTNGLAWSTRRRRVSLVKQLADTLNSIPESHPSYPHVSTELGEAAEALRSHSAGQRERALETFMYATLGISLAMFYGAQAFDHFVLGQPTNLTAESFRLVTLLLLFMGIASFALFSFAAVVRLRDFVRSSLERRRQENGGSHHGARD